MSILHRLYYIVKRLKYIWKINIMQYPRKTITADREEFLPETVTHQEAGEQRLTVHRRNSRLYYLYLPPEIREMANMGVNSSLGSPSMLYTNPL